MTISPFWKKVLALMSGSVMAQAINALMLPVLARLYLPETFGLFGVFLATVSVMVVVVNMGYEMTLMLPEKDEEARNLLDLSLLACLGITVLMVVLCATIPIPWLKSLGMEGLERYIWLLPLSIGLEGIIQPFGVALNRLQQYRALTRLRIARAIVVAGLSLIGGLADWHLNGLLAGHLGGQIIVVIGSIMAWIPRRARRSPGHTLQKLAWKYRDFPGFGMPSAWLNVASKQVIFFLLPGTFGEGPTGQYTKAERILNLPPGLLSMTVGKVFFEEASRAFRESREKLAEITLDTFRKLALLSLPVLIVLAVWGPELFSFVLGPRWRMAGEFARWLSPWLYLTMIASPLSYLIDIRRKLKAFFLINLAMFITRAGVLIVALQVTDVVTTVACFGAAGAGMVGAQIIYLLWLGGALRRNTVRDRSSGP